MSAKGIVVQSMPKDWTNWSKIKDDMTPEEKIKFDYNNSILIERRPYFMRYLYPNYNKEYKEYNESYRETCRDKFGCEIDNVPVDIAETEEFKIFYNKYSRYNKFLDTDGVMNRVCHYMENKCKDIKISVKEKSNEDYFKLYMDNSIDIDNDKLKMMIEKYNEYLTQKKNRNNLEDGNSFQKYCNDLKDSLFLISFDDNELANLAVYVCYVIYKNKPKDFAWDICGEGIIRNLIKNQQVAKLKIPMFDKEGDIKYLGKNYKVKEIEINGYNI